MKQCKLIIRDAVNVRFEGVDIVTRKQMTGALKFVVPSARHTPQYKLGRWDGTVSFCSPTGSTYLNVLDRVLPLLHDWEIIVDDRRPLWEFAFRPVDEQTFAHKTWPLGHTLAGQPIILRDYQVGAITRFSQDLQSVQQISTASGKTILAAALSWMIEPYGRSIIIVPNKTLVTQTEEDYRNVGLDVGVFYGDRKEYGHQHTICTWQSLGVFAKKSKSAETSMSIMEFIKDVICVIIDEVHSASANILKNLLCGPFAQVPVRWGLTGTIPKAEHEAISLLASIGPVVGHIRAVELQERGVLANCEVEIVQMIDDTVEFTNYDSEHHYLVSDKSRLQHIASRITSWAATGNTLVLVDRIPTGKTLLSLLGSDAVFVYGKTKNATRHDEYTSIQTATGKIIIATYGVAAVGINIPRIFNIVLLEAGRSFVRVIQSIGRGLRRTQDKNHVKIYDCCSTLPFSKRHLSKRKEYYREEQYPFVMTKVKH